MRAGPGRGDGGTGAGGRGARVPELRAGSGDEEIRTLARREWGAWAPDSGGV